VVPGIWVNALFKMVNTVVTLNITIVLAWTILFAVSYLCTKNDTACSGRLPWLIRYVHVELEGYDR
jgi:hypothetical protein